MNGVELNLTERVKRAEAMLARERGGFVLFGLFQREETAGKWDVVVSAPWLTTNRPGIQSVVDELKDHLTTQDWSNIGGIIPLTPDTEFVQTMTRLFETEHEILETGPFLVAGIFLDRAVIITASKRAADTAGQQRVAA